MRLTLNHVILYSDIISFQAEAASGDEQPKAEDAPPVEEVPVTKDT